MPAELAPPPAKTRATPKPSDETVAIRALRKIREIDASIQLTEVTASQKVHDRKAERAAILVSLNPVVRRIVDLQLAAEKPADSSPEATEEA